MTRAIDLCTCKHSRDFHGGEGKCYACSCDKWFPQPQPASNPVTQQKTVTVFAGARGKSFLYEDAEFIGRTLAKRGWHVMFGGSSKGLMGALCRGVKSEGGKITGVLPKKIHALNHFDPEIGMIVADGMADRKHAFWQHSDSFLCLPGGYGTLDEISEILTLTKLGYYPSKPIVVYNQGSFYNGLIDLFKQMVQAGCMEQERADLVRFTNSAFEACNLVTREPSGATGGL